MSAPQFFRWNIIEKHRQQFTNRAFSIVRDVQAAEDAVAAAMRKVVDSTQDLPTETDVIRYTHTAVRNECLDYLRRWTSRRRELTPAFTAPQSDTLVRIDAEKLLRMLDDRSRHILCRRFFDGYSDKEIAAELNLKPGHIAVIASRAFDRIRGNIRTPARIPH